MSVRVRISRRELPAKVIPKRLSVCSTRVLEVIRGRPSDGGMHLGMTLLRYWPVDPKERFVLEEGWHLHCH